MLLDEQVITPESDQDKEFISSIEIVPKLIQDSTNSFITIIQNDKLLTIILKLYVSTRLISIFEAFRVNRIIIYSLWNCSKKYNHLTELRNM